MQSSEKYSINLTPGEVKSLVEIFKSCFEIQSDELIRKNNSFFNKCFNNPETGLDYNTPTLNRTEIRPLTSDANFNKNYNNKAFLLGIDFPLFIRKKENIKNVMIISEDPLRNSKDKLINEKREQVILSTPFATHLEHCRNGALKEYWEIHKYLLENGHNVYLTDVNKLWMKENEQKKESMPIDFYNNLKLTLNKEIEFIQPEIIISYGRRAEKALKSMNISYENKTLHFPHPSRTANGAWRKYFNDPKMKCTYENKVKYVSKKLQERLDQNQF